MFNSLLSELSGKDLKEVIKAGTEKLASVPSGGGGGGGAAPAAAAGGAAPAAAKKEEKKEEEEEVVRAPPQRSRRLAWQCIGLGLLAARAAAASDDVRRAARRTWASRCSTKRALACRSAVANARGIKQPPILQDAPFRRRTPH